MKKLTTAGMMIGRPNVYADILYVSGFKAPDPVVYLETARRRLLVVSGMELNRARAECLGVSVLSPADLGLRRKQRRSVFEWAAGLLAREGVRRVDVPSSFPVGAARLLERRGVRVALDEEPFSARRAVKRPEEIEKIRAVQQAAARAMREVFRTLERARIDTRGQLRDGHALLTSEAMRMRINHTLLDDRCSGGEPIVACGSESADPHAVGHGPLMAGEPVVVDIFPQDQETGYWGDMTRTVVKGRPRREEVMRMFGAVASAHRRVLNSLRAGTTGAAMHRLAAAELERRGFRNETKDGIPQGFIHGTGHGVGLEIHEAPSLSLAGGRLRAGHVVTVEPGLYYSGIGGIRIEDTVVVGPNGCEKLAACPYPRVIA